MWSRSPTTISTKKKKKVHLLVLVFPIGGEVLTPPVLGPCCCHRNMVSYPTSQGADRMDNHTKQ